ncbi:MAG: hypothetical protein V4692_02505, partial [Bdellovibrionota bacterium]
MRVFSVVLFTAASLVATSAFAQLESPPTPNVPTGLTPLATPRPLAKAKKKESGAFEEFKKNCERHYSGSIQGELRSACASAFEDFSADAIDLAHTRCRLDHGEEPRLVMACLIGAAILEDVAKKSDTFKTKLQVCAEHYPQHTEIDAFLQESCLTGVHIPELLKTKKDEGFLSCAQISPERSFIGPCAVGFSLAGDLKTPSTPRQQNKLCEKYFDHRRFHLTYRACLNARSVSAEKPDRLSELISRCANVVSDPGNDNERAACVIGSNIHRSLVKNEDVTLKFM